MPAAPDSARRGGARWALALALLVLLGAVALVALPGGDEDAAPVEAPARSAPAGGGAELHHFTLASDAVGEELGTSVLVPPGAGEGPRPLLVFLHGLGGDENSFTGNTALLDALADLGARAPIVAFPNGLASFWYDRDEGEWGTYVVREVIPAVADRFGADPRRVAIGGISMGGFGAYHLGIENRERFCGVGGHSPALWLDYEESGEFPVAFDDADAFDENDLIATVREDPGAFGATPVWIDTGDEDWFLPGFRAFRDALRGTDLTAHEWPGGHDGAYWDSHWDSYLGFYARSLAQCRSAS